MQRYVYKGRPRSILLILGSGMITGIVLLSGCAGNAKSDNNDFDITKGQVSVEHCTIHEIDGRSPALSDMLAHPSLRIMPIEKGGHIVSINCAMSKPPIYTARCDVIAGHTYTITRELHKNTQGICHDNGPTPKATEALLVQNQQKYMRYKVELRNKQTEAYLNQIKLDLTSGQPGFTTDPDGLLVITNQQLAPYIEASNKTRAEEHRQYEVRQAANAKALEEKNNTMRRETNEFRSKIKVGDQTNCGLVIEVKRPIAQIQASVGAVWLSINQLYPSDVAGCTFINNVYMEPHPY